MFQHELVVDWYPPYLPHISNCLKFKLIIIFSFHVKNVKVFEDVELQEKVVLQYFYIPWLFRAALGIMNCELVWHKPCRPGL